MNIESLTDGDKAELNTRLLSIDIVSWQWNEKGLKIHKAEGRTDKLENKPEIGVLAQTVQNTLQDLFPNIILIHSTSALMVNYTLLAKLAELTLSYLDRRYKELVPISSDLSLPQLIKQYRTNDIQLYAARLLALIKKYNQKIEEKKNLL